MEIGETLLVETGQAWRAWLRKHAASKREIWLVTYKKGTGKRSLDYSAALDEALCFGWIDSQSKGVDAERYVLRWSPRRPRGNWTADNLERVRRLLQEGRMTPEGIAKLPAGALETLTGTGTRGTPSS